MCVCSDGDGSKSGFIQNKAVFMNSELLLINSKISSVYRVEELKLKRENIRHFFVNNWFLFCLVTTNRLEKKKSLVGCERRKR